jgi:hypothetical protein
LREFIGPSGRRRKAVASPKAPIKPERTKQLRWIKSAAPYPARFRQLPHLLPVQFVANSTREQGNARSMKSVSVIGGGITGLVTEFDAYAESISSTFSGQLLSVL